ncbi:MAG: YdcF family protein [Pseudobdellovibrionaceae bacterium]
MFFYLSKIFWMIFSPLTFVTLLIVFGALLRRWKAGRVMLGAGIILIGSIGFLPLGKNMLVYLEGIYPWPDISPERVDGIIVLGGSFDLDSSYAHGSPQLGSDGARILEFVALSHRYPQARLVFTGGSGAIEAGGRSEAEVARQAFESLGLDMKRVEFEGESRNTYENMILSRSKVHPQAGENWLLVTSAYHMPRSVAIFRTGGWEVIPCPAGYLTDGHYSYLPTAKVLEGFFLFHVAVREMIGIIAYVFTGKIESDVFAHDSPVSRRDGSSLGAAS